MPIQQKYTKLQNILRELKFVVVAFSGGVDSTFLLKVARDTLGAENVLALTASSPTYPEYELEESRELARHMGVRQEVVESNELEIPGFARNDRMRCYHCKLALFGICGAKAKELGYHFILDGSNLDDLSDYRPGRQAALELDVRSPLLEAELTKNDIRYLSRELGLPTWFKQPFACLSSRFPYGVEITAERLRQVGHCEAFLRKHKFNSYRVRYHHETARIEVAVEDFARFLDEEFRSVLLAEFKVAGFTYVALDLEGYRTGSMNEPVP